MRWEGLKVDKKLDYLMSEIEGWVTMTNKLSIGVRNLEGSTPSLTAEIADLRKWHWAQPRGCHQCGLSGAELSALQREPAHSCGQDMGHDQDARRPALNCPIWSHLGPSLNAILKYLTKASTLILGY
jgi:hypothetical protein